MKSSYLSTRVRSDAAGLTRSVVLHPQCHCKKWSSAFYFVHSLEPGGFGESLGNDVSVLRTAIGPCSQLLEECRTAGVLVVHTREGHRPDLSDLPRYVLTPLVGQIRVLSSREGRDLGSAAGANAH